MEPLIKNLVKPDNIPLVAMVPATIVLLIMWWRVARRNDRILEKGGEEALAEDMEGARPETAEAAEGEVVTRVHTWPYLVRVEFIATLVVMLLLTIWAITIDAPLEQIADPSRTPNPSKAPWYFLGLQEMLVYFDPWIAGVMLPFFIIGGLAIIPYVDVNPAGNGYYSWRKRRFSIVTFLFGFIVLWQLLILVGVFCRGPGWGWFWPWEKWDAQLVPTDPTVNLTDFFGITSATVASWVGALFVAAYYGLGVMYWYLKRGTETLIRLGRLRYAIVAFLYLSMLALPIKMALRLALSVKYVWITPWFRI